MGKDKGRVNLAGRGRIFRDGIFLTRGQINPGTQSWERLGLQNRRNQVISRMEWTMRVPEAVTGASPERRLLISMDFNLISVISIDFNVC